MQERLPVQVDIQKGAPIGKQCTEDFSQPPTCFVITLPGAINQLRRRSIVPTKTGRHKTRLDRAGTEVHELAVVEVRQQ